MITSSSFLTTDGTIRPGSYLYMLFCMDGDGPLYIEIGRSQNPHQRLETLRTNCPVKPVQWAVCPVRTFEHARELEKLLLAATRQWNVRGEWLSLTLEDRQAFNEKWKALFAEESDYAWILRWDMHDVSQLEQAARVRQICALRRLKRRGRAYQDFVRDSRH